jgi:hypothetical protein
MFTAAAAVLVPTPPAGAAAVFVSHAWVPDPFYADTYSNCVYDNDVAGGYAHVPGPGKPPAGGGSLRVSADAGKVSEVGRSWSGDETSMSAFTFSVLVPSTPSSNAYAGLWGWEGSVVHVAKWSLPHNGTWTSVNFRDGRTLQTYDLNPDTHEQSNPGQMSYATWVSTYTNVDFMNPFIDVCGTSQTASIYLDKLRILKTGETDTLVDFEPMLTNTASRSTVVYGGSVTLRTTLYRDENASDGQKVSSGESVSLWAKPAGASSFSKVNSTAIYTAADGTASFKTKPKKNTVYEWRVGASVYGPAAASARRTIGVARKLTIAVADKTLSASQKLKASGKEIPAKPGSTLTVWRHNASSNVKIGTATVHTDGTWAFSGDLPKGSFGIFVRSKADTKFVAGKSPMVSVTSA